MFGSSLAPVKRRVVSRRTYDVKNLCQNYLYESMKAVATPDIMCRKVSNIIITRKYPDALHYTIKHIPHKFKE